jgi:cytoskeleton protein RodZ
MVSGTVHRFGEELHRERVAREISLEEISSATKISIRLLTALEQSDLSRLPAPVFTRGFIRSYAQYIGIDPEEKVCAYLADVAELSTGVQTPPIASPRKFWRRRGATAGSVVGGVTVVLLILGLIAKPERRPAARAEKPTSSRTTAVALKHVALSSEPTPYVRPVEAAPAPAAAPAPEVAGTKDPRAPVTLVLEIDEDSWTKLDAGGRTLFSGLLRRGETRRFESRDGFRITLGNAGGVRATVDGRAQEPLGRAGQVVRDVPLPLQAARG